MNCRKCGRPVPGIGPYFMACPCTFKAHTVLRESILGEPLTATTADVGGRPFVVR